jgi:hypothetical protein
MVILANCVGDEEDRNFKMLYMLEISHTFREEDGNQKNNSFNYVVSDLFEKCVGRLVCCPY